jgi:hypothetical protein
MTRCLPLALPCLFAVWSCSVESSDDDVVTANEQSAVTDDVSHYHALPLDSGYRITAIDVTFPSTNLIRTQLTVQPDSDPLNQIFVTRIRKIVHQHPLNPVMVAGPFGFGVKYYEINDLGYAHSWAGMLANNDYDVWVTDDRTTKDLQLGTCDTGAVDCSAMANWTLATKVQDETFTRSLVGLFHSQKPVITGNVGGAIAAIAPVNAHPNDYSGLLSYQGALISNDPAVRAYDAPFCGFLTTLFDAGVIFDDSSVPLIALFRAAQEHPNDPAPPMQGVPPGLTNLQLYLLIITVHADSPQLPTPTWVTAVGDFQADTLTYTSLTQLFQLNPQFTTFLPVATFRDALCALAGTDNTHVANLSAFDGRVLFYGSERAFGPLGADNAALFTGATSTQVIDVPDRGEVDVFLNTDRETFSDPVVLGFLHQVF